MPIYAEVQNGKVVSISNLTSVMVPLETADNRLLGTNYSGTLTNGVAADFSGYKTVLTTDKAEIDADGVDTATITITVKTWDDVAAPNFSGDIYININGARKLLTVANGVATYAYHTTKEGNYAVTAQDTTDTHYIAHGSLSITAYAAL